MKKALLLAASIRLALPLLVSCSATPAPRVAGKLPFVLRVTALPEITESSEGDVVIPARFDAGTTNTLKKHLENVFVRVVDEGPADLEAKVQIVGRDFGEGKVRVGPASLSTLLWLAAGHLSWFIDDQYFPDSNVRMTMTISTVGESTGDSRSSHEVYTGQFVLNDLKLSQLERASFPHALLNFLVPPSLLAGDRRVVGTSLSRRAVEAFAKQEAFLIPTVLPQRHLDLVACFLVHDDATIILASKERILNLKIGGIEGVELPLDQIERLREQDHEEIRARFSSLSSGLGTGQFHFYEVAVDAHDGFIPIKARLRNGSVGRWTIYREPEARETPDS